MDQSKEEIEKLFPFEFEITNEIIQEGRKNIYNSNKCIGALSLKSVLNTLKIGNECSWGFVSGTLYELDNEYRLIPMLIISTIEEINFMTLIKPTKVTFQTIKQYE